MEQRTIQKAQLHRTFCSGGMAAPATATACRNMAAGIQETNFSLKSGFFLLILFEGQIRETDGETGSFRRCVQ